MRATSPDPTGDRRWFVRRAAAACGAALLGLTHAESRPPKSVLRAGGTGVDVLRSPDRVTVQTETETLDLKPTGGRWNARGIEVGSEPQAGSLPVWLSAPGQDVKRLHLRWRGAPPPAWRYLGDHWERSYGDLEWRSLVAERVMPWYFLASDGHELQGYGLKTGARAMGFWQIDDAGVSLWLDVRNGGSGVRLGERRIEAATIVTAASRGHARLLAGAQDFCHRLCDRPRLPAAPVYGWNNWYYTYGVGFSSNDIRRDCAALAQLAPARAEHRPFMLIDMGWGVAPDGAGPWNRGNDRFADLPDLAPQMKAAGVRPGIWMRPLLTTESLAERWLLPDRGVTKPGFAILDPTVPQALERVRAAVQTLAGWGFELIKHDFTTYDLLGKWGFQMGGDVTTDGWHFADRSVTTAEVILRLYRAIREAAGSALLIGCNTVGHLGAGLFELQRIGDDNSGFDWHRTRRMGVNALAFRMAQHQRFFAADADCAPLTAKVPWSMSRQWLDLLARSGTPLFVSADPTQLNPEQHQAVQAALAAAAQDLPPAEPLDWLETSVPRRWRLGQRTATYDWLGDEGASAWSR